MTSVSIANQVDELVWLLILVSSSLHLVHPLLKQVLSLDDQCRWSDFSIALYLLFGSLDEGVKHPLRRLVNSRVFCETGILFKVNFSGVHVRQHTRDKTLVLTGNGPLLSKFMSLLL